MTQRLKYPVGIHTFSEIIKGNYLYVDKTGLLYEMVKRHKYVFLSRPRRFGKSLLMSTLGSYFKGQRELFKGLAIDDLETEWTEYPVFRFDLSPENYSHSSRLISRIHRCLAQLEEEYSLKGDGETISDRFGVLIRQAYERTGKKVVILIDEYDKPMLDCLDIEEQHEIIKGELRGFYSVIKANDEYVKFAMLTGITRFSRVSVFSGFNNLSDISLLPRYNAICGISETEFHNNFSSSIKSFAETHGWTEEETWTRFKEQYDGYHFAERGEFIYNPYSVLCAFNDDKLSAFWFRSASPSFLIKLVGKHNYPLDCLEGQKRSENDLSSIDNLDGDLVSLLFQTGYLTITGYDEATELYTLGFPNKEVKKGFWESLSKHFFNYGNGSPFDLQRLLSDLNEGNPDKFMLRIQSLLSDIPYDNEDSHNLRKKENHFRDMMVIISKLLGVQVRSEVHSASGRCDMQILTDRFIYIFEFKINSTPENALEQIHTKGYTLPFGADHRTKFLIGANFSTAQNALTSWLIEEMHLRS